MESSIYSQSSSASSSSSNVTVVLDTKSPSSQLLARTLDFPPKPATPNAGRIWHLPEKWKWDVRGGPRGQVHSSSQDFSGQEIAILGKGASGEVVSVLCNNKYLARKKTSVNPNTPYEMRRNIEEINIQKNLNHQHIVELCGVYLHDQDLYSLHYPVAEMSLYEFLKLGRTNDPNWINVLFCGMGCLANALAYTHANGVKHKDIHSGNILILGGVMILCDWGASRWVRTSAFIAYTC